MHPAGDAEHCGLIHFCRSLSVPITRPPWLSPNAKQWQRYCRNGGFCFNHGLVRWKLKYNPGRYHMSSWPFIGLGGKIHPVRIRNKAVHPVKDLFPEPHRINVHPYHHQRKRSECFSLSDYNYNLQVIATRTRCERLYACVPHQIYIWNHILN